MRTFKNSQFRNIDPDCTNIVFCQAEERPSENWIECEERELKESTFCNTLLYIQANVKYYGCL